MKRPRGTGSILRMKGSSALWIKYHRNGKPIRESAHTTKVKEAEKLLRERLSAISTGTYVGPKLGHIYICLIQLPMVASGVPDERGSCGISGTD